MDVNYGSGSVQWSKKLDETFLGRSQKKLCSSVSGNVNKIGKQLKNLQLDTSEKKEKTIAKNLSKSIDSLTRSIKQMGTLQLRITNKGHAEAAVAYNNEVKSQAEQIQAAIKKLPEGSKIKQEVAPLLEKLKNTMRDQEEITKSLKGERVQLFQPHEIGKPTFLQRASSLLGKITGSASREVNNIYVNGRTFDNSITSIRSKMYGASNEEELSVLETELDILEQTVNEYKNQSLKSRREKQAFDNAFRIGMMDIKTLRSTIERSKRTFQLPQQLERDIQTLRDELGTLQKVADLQDLLSKLNAKFTEVRTSYEIPINTRNRLQGQVSRLISDVKDQIKTKNDEVAIDSRAAEALVLARRAQKIAADPMLSEDHKRNELSKLNNQIKDKTTELNQMSIDLESQTRLQQTLDLIFKTREGVAAENNRLVLKDMMVELSEIKNSFEKLKTGNPSRKEYAEDVSYFYGEVSYFSQTIKNVAKEAAGMTEDVLVLMEQCDQLLAELEPQLQRDMRGSFALRQSLKQTADSEGLLAKLDAMKPIQKAADAAWRMDVAERNLERIQNSTLTGDDVDEVKAKLTDLIQELRLRSVLPEHERLLQLMQDPKANPLEVLKLDKEPPLDDIEKARSSLRLLVQNELKDDPRLDAILGFINSAFDKLTEGKYAKLWTIDSFTAFNRSSDIPEIPDNFKGNANIDRLRTLYLSDKKPSAYEVLGLAPGASSAAMKRAWFTIAKDLHPDKGLPTQFLDLFKWAQAAYELLTNK